MEGLPSPGQLVYLLSGLRVPFTVEIFFYMFTLSLPYFHTSLLNGWIDCGCTYTFGFTVFR